MVGVVLVVLSVLSASLGLVMVAAQHRLTTIEVDFPTSGTQVDESDPGDETWLIVGSDERVGRYAEPGTSSTQATDEATVTSHADVILVVRRSRYGVDMASVPRDLVVTNSERLPVRLGMVLSLGEDEFVRTMCRSLGLAFDHLVVVGMGGLEDAVDSAGGIEISLDEPLLDVASGVDLQAGTHLIDGRTAVALVRSRNSGSDGTHPSTDVLEAGTLRRASMATVVLRSLSDRISPPWRHPIRATLTGWALLGSITVDQHTSINDMRSLMSSIGASTTVVVPSEPLPGSTGSAVPARRMTDGAADVLRSVGASLDPTTSSPVACDRS